MPCLPSMCRESHGYITGDLLVSRVNTSQVTSGGPVKEVNTIIALGMQSIFSRLNADGHQRSFFSGRELDTTQQKRIQDDGEYLSSCSNKCCSTGHLSNDILHRLLGGDDQ